MRRIIMMTGGILLTISLIGSSRASRRASRAELDRGEVGHGMLGQGGPGRGEVGQGELQQGELDRLELLRVRESVWRAWFANDTNALHDLVPPDTIVISAGEEKWKHQADIFRTAAEFQSSGGKLVRLEFPRTEVQRFGDVAIVWSQYAVEIEAGGKKDLTSGRVTEIFVRRNGEWTNPGWHTDAGK